MTGIALVSMLLAASPAFAEEVRFGVFVGNNEGQVGELPLLFAVSDAKKMRDLFVDHGDIRPNNATLLTDSPRRQVQTALDSLHSKMVAANNRGDHTTLVFYYSGHGDDVSLHLGSTRVEHEELRRWLENSGADVRIAMLDACQSGAAIRTKGGRRGPDLEWAVNFQEIRGTAFLTSSAASELSQESSHVGGGFFTHYLHSALLGAADYNKNGEVSLAEARTFVHGETAFSTRDTPNAQTPVWDADMTGSGDLFLTQLEDASSRLAFQGALDGTYAVWDDQRKRYVAEVSGDQAMSVAVRPGSYYVHKRMPGWVDEAHYQVRKGETLAIYPEDFHSVAYEDTASRGELDRQVRRAQMPDLSLRAAFGGRAWGDVFGSQYIPAHGIAGIEGRFIRTGRTWFAFDLLTGGGRGSLTFDELGERDVSVGSTSFGASVGFATRPGLVRAGIGGKSEVIGVRRTFPDGSTDPQSSTTISVGPTTFIGLYHGRFSLDLEASMLIMATGFDSIKKRPVYFEPLFAIGYRF